MATDHQEQAAPLDGDVQLNQLSESGRRLAPDLLIERSQIPLADPPGFSYALKESVSTGVPGRFLPRLLCGAYIGGFQQVWLGTDAGYVSIWQTDTRRQIVRFKPHRSAIAGIVALRQLGSDTVAILARDGHLSFWTAASWTQRATVQIYDNTADESTPSADTSSSSSSPSSSSSSSSSSDQAASGTNRRGTSSPSSSSSALNRVPDQPSPSLLLAGSELLICGNFPTTTTVHRVLALPPYTVLPPIELPGFHVSAMLYVPQRQELWLGAQSGRIVVLPFTPSTLSSSSPSAVVLPDNFEQLCFDAHKGRVTALCLAGERVWSASVDTHIHAWNAGAENKYWSYYGHATPVHSLTGVSSQHVASTDAAGQLVVWSAHPTEQQPKQPHSRVHLVCPNVQSNKFAHHEGPIAGLLVLDDLSIWAYGWDGVVTIWERSPRDHRLAKLPTTPKSDTALLVPPSHPLELTSSSPPALSPRSSSSSSSAASAVINSSSSSKARKSPKRKSSKSSGEKSSSKSSKHHSSSKSSSSKSRSAKSASSTAATPGE